MSLVSKLNAAFQAIAADIKALAVGSQSAIAKKAIGWVAGQYGSSSISAVGMTNFSSIGTGITRGYSTDTFMSRSVRTGKYSASAAGSMVAMYVPFQAYMLGDGTTLGKGFYCKFRFGVSDSATVSGARMFVGLNMSTSAPSNVEPSTLVNCIGIAQLSTDSTQLYLVYGGSTAQAAIPLGSNFPIADVSNSSSGGTLYDLHITSSRFDNRKVTIQLDRVGTSYSYTTTLSDPSTTAALPFWAMGPQIWRSNNTTALAVAFDFCHFYVETDI